MRILTLISSNYTDLYVISTNDGQVFTIGPKVSIFIHLLEENRTIRSFRFWTITTFSSLHISIGSSYKRQSFGNNRPLTVGINILFIHELKL